MSPIVPSWTRSAYGTPRSIANPSPPNRSRRCWRHAGRSWQSRRRSCTRSAARRCGADRSQRSLTPRRRRQPASGRRGGAPGRLRPLLDRALRRRRTRPLTSAQEEFSLGMSPPENAAPPDRCEVCGRAIDDAVSGDARSSQLENAGNLHRVAAERSPSPPFAPAIADWQSDHAESRGRDHPYVANSIVSSAMSGGAKQSSAAPLPGDCITPIAATAPSWPLRSMRGSLSQTAAEATKRMRSPIAPGSVRLPGGG